MTFCLPCWRAEVADAKDEVNAITELIEQKTATLQTLAPLPIEILDAEPTTWTNSKKGLPILTKKTFNRMRYRAMRGELGKSTPQWTLPREIWRIFFMPDMFAKNKRGDLHPESKIAVTAPLR